MKVRIINGPNLNKLGKRDEKIYGSLTLKAINAGLVKEFPSAVLDFFQSNIEGELVNFIQDDENYDALVINAGAYSHYSYAIRDALECVKKPKIEVHLSNIYARDEFRHNSVISAVCNGSICGFGKDSYVLAIQYLIRAAA